VAATSVTCEPAGGARGPTAGEAGGAGAAGGARLSPPRAAAQSDGLHCASGGGGGSSAAPRRALVSDGERALAAAREAVARVLAEED
jgi:hypothetical protein